VSPVLLRFLDRVHLALPRFAAVLLWFALPMSTMGVTTGLFLLAAGYRLRRRRYLRWGWAYLVMVVLFFAAGTQGKAAVGITMPCFFMTFLVGAFHSGSAGGRVWDAVRWAQINGALHAATSARRQATSSGLRAASRWRAS
jgi:hypothetical protein